MTQSLMLQLTEKQDEIQMVQSQIAMATTLEKKFELTEELDRLLQEMGQIRTVYNTWQINELKILEAKARGY